MGLKHQAASARKWRAAIRQVETHFPAFLPPLLFLTDPARVPDPVGVIRALPGNSGVIYRHFGDADRHSVAAQLRAACNQHNHRLLIAADPQLALDVNADGVHWPEARLGLAWRWRGRFAIQTASAHSLRAINHAQAVGMNAALFSAVFPSSSRSAGRPIGPARLRIARRQAEIALYALGGINAGTASRVSGTAGLAGIDGLISN